MDAASTNTALEIYALKLAEAASRVSVWMTNDETLPPEDLQLELIVWTGRVQRLLQSQAQKAAA